MHRRPEQLRNCVCGALLMLLAPLAQANDDELMGFIVDNAISHIGHDFYRYFSERLRDTSRLDFNLVVRERPSARWGSLVWVEYEQAIVYRSFLPPNTTELKAVAYQAADQVLEAITRQRLQMQLQDTTDMERDEL
ncbi:Curli production assembly/transport component CsgE [compost metagenome]